MMEMEAVGVVGLGVKEGAAASPRMWCSPNPTPSLLAPPIHLPALALALVACPCGYGGGWWSREGGIMMRRCCAGFDKQS